MALFHFVNCSLTAFAPYYIIYEGFKLARNEGFIKLFLIVCFYYITSQIAKLFALAFFSIGLLQHMNIFNIIFQESANVIDLAGIYYIFLNKNASTLNLKERILSIGLSWGFIDSVATNFFPFFIGAKSLDFSLKYIYRSISANILLVSNLCKVALLFVWVKNAQNKKKINFTNLLLMYFTFILPLLNKLILLHEELNSIWVFNYLILLFLLTIILSLVTKFVFNSQLKSSFNSNMTKQDQSYTNDKNENDYENDMTNKSKNKNKKKSF
ncbi:transmembrane protein 147, putative [Hepatocystis sp. ex Piliocolobus tephrosceles]|nr:transmembrane protein 147, putative [Hepatocystis sp. ex Piliocolobus tephrosceles]